MPTDAPTRPHFSPLQRIRYRFDNALTRGVSLILVWLGIATLAIILIVALVEWLLQVGPEDASVPFLESAWLALTRMLDPGTFGADSGTRFRLMMLLVTLAGILFLAIVIGLISNSIDRRLESLREGRSLVVETDHTLILGYSQKVPAMVRELVEANLSRRKPAVVILSEVAPAVVHDAVRAQGIDLHNTRLVVRRGSPSSMEDLARMNAGFARSVVVVAPEDDAADSIVVKNTLALKRFGIDLDDTAVVAEVSDPFIASALSDIGGTGVLTVNPLLTVARITARVLRTSGVGVVYEDMLDFQGDEIYTLPVTERYVGRPFGDLLLASTHSSVIGLVRGSEVLAVPDSQTVVESGDRVIAISADDATLELDREPVTVGPPRSYFTIEMKKERALVIGWSRLGMAICQDNEAQVLNGSEMTILLDPDMFDPDRVSKELALERQSVRIVTGNAVHGAIVDQLLTEHDYDHVLVLAERDNLSYQEADARALLAMLHVRRWYDKHPEVRRRPNLVGELLDVNDEIIGEIARPDDFIVSERLVSLALTQLSENPSIYPVLRRLLDGDGVQVALVGADDVVMNDIRTFADVVVACHDAGLVAIGCQVGVKSDGDVSQARVLVNPPKDKPLDFTRYDRAVVLARTE